MSRLRDRGDRHDRYFRQAKKEKYAARSVFKLQELDRRFRLLRAGLRVLDLGCYPGSWLQYAAQRVGPGGFVVGLDRRRPEIALPDQTTVVLGDARELAPEVLREALPDPQARCFHLVLSDMAPDTTGIKLTDQARSIELFGRALELARFVGCPSGSFVGKLFMGEELAAMLARARQQYTRVRTVRPKATRRFSSEVFLVGLGLRAGSLPPLPLDSPG